MLYTVQIQESLTAELQIEAEDKEHAVALVMERYYTCDVVLDSGHFSGVTFNVKENEDA